MERVMVEVRFVEFDGTETVVSVDEGTTLMSAGVNSGIAGIRGDCGGACACATCHCYIDEGFLGLLAGPEDVEAAMLDFASNPKSNSRLGCQITLDKTLDGIVVRLPESQY